jgi:hypothetical protein
MRTQAQGRPALHGDVRRGAKMPPVVIQAAEEAQSTENRNKGMWAGG